LKGARFCEKSAMVVLAVSVNSNFSKGKGFQRKKLRAAGKELG